MIASYIEEEEKFVINQNKSKLKNNKSAASLF